MVTLNVADKTVPVSRAGYMSNAQTLAASADQTREWVAATVEIKIAFRLLFG